MAFPDAKLGGEHKSNYESIRGTHGFQLRPLTQEDFRNHAETENPLGRSKARLHEMGESQLATPPTREPHRGAGQLDCNKYIEGRYMSNM